MQHRVAVFMDPEEGGALAAAREPLVHDSDPQSPGSPFSSLLTTTAPAEDELYRTASATKVLRGLGGVFRDQYEFLRSGDAEADAAAEGFCSSDCSRRRPRRISASLATAC